MEDLTGNLMAGIVVGLSRMMGAPVLKVIDSLGVGETEEERQVGNRAWTKMIVGALLRKRVLAKEM